MEKKDKKQVVIRIEEPEVVLRSPDIPAPPEGKAWKRMYDGVLFYSDVYLGEIFFLNGKKLKKPIKELPEDFELVEID